MQVDSLSELLAEAAGGSQQKQISCTRVLRIQRHGQAVKPPPACERAQLGADLARPGDDEAACGRPTAQAGRAVSSAKAAALLPLMVPKFLNLFEADALHSTPLQSTVQVLRGPILSGQLVQVQNSGLVLCAGAALQVEGQLSFQNVSFSGACRLLGVPCF